MRDLLTRMIVQAEYDLSSVIKPEIESEFDSASGAVITLAQIICYGAAVIILMLIGIKFITAAPEGKAQIKEKMVPATIGAIILFAVGTIIKIVGGYGINNI